MELKVTELKQKLLDGGLTEEELKTRVAELLEEIPIIYSSPNGKRLMYVRIAKEKAIPLQVTRGVSAAEVFPMKISEVFESEKDNFTISGFPVGGFRPTKNGDIYMEVADDTGIITVKVWAEQVDQFEDLIDSANITQTTFIKLKNLWWKDKDKFQPNFSKNSSIEKVDEEYSIQKALMNTTADIKNDKIFYLKMVGIIVSVEPSAISKIFHCEAGHRFKGASKDDIGTKKMCTNDKCNKPMEVLYYLNGKVSFGDRNGFIDLDISVFQQLDEINEGDEVFVVVKHGTDSQGNEVNRVYEYQVLKKNKVIQKE